ncbi:MAG: SsrA-binding protein SmpB [Candidatus Abyssobacteria bacterium SURF_17]|uniref:SsrA-binding protein n=1 Tax=Candidatus Abyssobacteria bacterium SURF_17 TaxID=2093361 RepID=A0A419F7N2_9BACT|nr:MAG: SsrA-binding protein SmpB [Candidatus Abyssubacteria bacterium SURF_17]
MGEKIVVFNRKARHNYEIIESFEAGMVLQGTEVKSLREGRMSLKDSYATVDNGEIFLVNAHISPYSHGNIQNHDPLRGRKLLLHKAEIKRLTGKTEEKGLTMIPLKVYFSRGRAKVELALARGKKEYDKREAIKRRDADREIERELKHRQHQ